MMASVAAINNLSEYAHNPRGNLWFNDESTYGHKLLAKMGWNKGKGLGKNESGITENLKVKFRNTNSGLGFKDDAHANVMKTEYESILKNLSAVYSSSDAGNLCKNVDNSEEKTLQKTKVVKSKLRYPKLFFGKDVTKYSEKDMKSIFICSTPLKSLEEKPENFDDSGKKDLESISSQTLQTYSSSLSVSDYFARKMEEKKNNNANKQLSSNIINHQTSLETNNVVFEESNDVEKLNEVITETKGLGAENSVLSYKKSSKRKKKKPQISTKDVEINLGEVDPCVSNVTEEEVLENSLSKNIHGNDLCIVEKSSKPSKKRKLSETFENNSVESSEITHSSETKCLSPPKKKKKKNKIKKYSATIESPCENDSPIEVNENTTDNFFAGPDVNGLSKKKSKRKLKGSLKSCLKKKCGSYSFKNVSFNETVSYKVIDSDIESVDPLASSANLDENSVSCNLTDIDQNNSDDNTNSEEKLIPCEQNSDNDVCENDQDKVSEELDKDDMSSDLPSSKSSHYNSWVESQRQAIKMELYKKMLKIIKKHKLFKTTNLFSIKGYGNWGFK